MKKGTGDYDLMIPGTKISAGFISRGTARSMRVIKCFSRKTVVFSSDSGFPEDSALILALRIVKSMSR